MKKKINKILSIGLVTFGAILIAIGIIGQNRVPGKNVVSGKYQMIEDPISDYKKYYKDILKTLIYADSYLLEEYPIKDFQDMSNNDKSKFLLNILSSKTEENLTREKVNRLKKKYFSPATVLSFEDIVDKEGKVLYSYDKSSRKFKVTNNDFGRDYLIGTKEIDSNIDKEKWVIKRKIYYVEFTPIDNPYPRRYYKSKEDLINKQSEIFTISSAEVAFTDEDFALIQDQLETVVYTFRKFNNNYILESIEKE